MPTGYTSDIYEGKPITFPEFVMECARAFGALVTLRDAPTTPIPDEFKPDTSYYDESLIKHRAELVRLEALAPEEIAAEHAEHRAEKLKRRTEAAVRNREMRKRYQAMLDEVDAWEPPTLDHVELKEFMQQQLRDSMKFDCPKDGYVEPLGDDDPVAWYEAKLDRERRAIEYDEKHIADEIERAEKRTAWVRALRDSLNVEAVA